MKKPRVRSSAKSAGGQVVGAALVAIETMVGVIHLHLYLVAAPREMRSTVSMGMSASLVAKVRQGGHKGVLNHAQAARVMPPP
jgi:hypothetical protein